MLHKSNSITHIQLFRVGATTSKKRLYPRSSKWTEGRFWSAIFGRSYWAKLTINNVPRDYRLFVRDLQ